MAYAERTWVRVPSVSLFTGMSSYTDRTTIEYFCPPAQVAQMLTWNDTPTSVTGSKLDFMISAQSDYIDFMLRPKGYTVPLTMVPDFISQTVALLVIKKLFQEAQRKIPEFILQEIDFNMSFLTALSNQKGSFGELNQDNTTGTGGHLFSATTGRDSHRTFFQRKNVGGSGF